MIARSATTSTSGNDTVDAPAELITIIKTLLCRYFFFYRHEIGQFDNLMNAVFESLPDQKRDATVLSVGPLTHQIIR
jgi:hypothetical protein